MAYLSHRRKAWQAVSGGGGGITVNVLTSEVIVPSGSTVTTASVTPGANRLILAIITARFTVEPSDDIFSVAGNGLTWVRVNEEQHTINRTVAVFRSMGASPSSGTIVFTESDDDGYTGNACVSILEFSGVDTTGTNGSGAVGTPTSATLGNSNDTSLGLTITGTPTGGDVTFATIGCLDGRTITTDALWDTIDTAGPSDEVILRNAWDTGQDLTPTWTWTPSSPAATIGFIINAA
jgi:hypothetical protein